MNLINKKDNIFGDEIAFVEQYDFSTANLNEKSRIHAISAVASICYQNPKAVGSESLYNRLLAESKGLPSSSFEMCPILFTEEEIIKIEDRITPYVKLEMSIFKYSEQIEHNNSIYLLTNYRALVYDVEKGYLPKEYLKRFNTVEECKIIKQYFKVFNFKVDLPTRSQMVRHRCSWQELSRRYVSGERVPFEFYISDKMGNVTSTAEKEIWFEKDDGSESTRTGIFNQTTQSIIDDCLAHYKQALADGVKPQEARRIIPQCAYTQIWGAFMPKQLDNYFKLRLDSTAQYEVRKTAEAMQELIEKESTNGI